MPSLGSSCLANVPAEEVLGCLENSSRKTAHPGEERSCVFHLILITLAGDEIQLPIELQEFDRLSEFENPCLAPERDQMPLPRRDSAMLSLVGPECYLGRCRVYRA